MTRDLLLWGATGQARVLAELIIGTDLRLVAIVDQTIVASPIENVPLLGGPVALDEWLHTHYAGADLFGAIAVGGARGADRIMLQSELLRRHILPITLIHRSAFVAGDAEIGEGCQILANAAVCTHAKLGRSVIINTASSVDHDCVIGDGAHIGPGAHLAGEITVGARVFIGTGAAILPRISIGDDAIVGAGAVVTRNIPPSVVVAGNPARPLQR